MIFCSICCLRFVGGKVHARRCDLARSDGHISVSCHSGEFWKARRGRSIGFALLSITLFHSRCIERHDATIFIEVPQTSILTAIERNFLLLLRNTFLRFFLRISRFRAKWLDSFSPFWHAHIISAKKKRMAENPPCACLRQCLEDKDQAAALVRFCRAPRLDSDFCFAALSRSGTSFCLTVSRANCSAESLPVYS